LFSSITCYSQVPEKFNYQGVIRNSSGELIKNTSITVRVSLLQGSTTGAVQYSENHAVATNNYGQFTIQIGGGTDATNVFTSIDWSQQFFLKTEVANPVGGTFVDMGTSQLIAVPYALYAKNVANKDDADADPVNEIQDLNLTGNTLTITNKTNPTAIDLAPFSGVNTDNQTLNLTNTDLSISGGNTVDLSPLQDGVNDADNNPTNELQSLTLTGDTLRISNGNHVVFPYDSSKWATNGNKLYYNTGNVGIGTNDPTSKLEIKSSATGALFQVINANNDTVFAVYPDGVKVFVDPDAKGKVGGFAVSGRTPTKLGETVEYFRVTPDSTRVYVNDSYNGKGKVGGFAVSGRTPTKGVIKDYFYINKDSTRIYINDTLTSKGKVGGFAVSGRTPTKGFTNEYFFVNQDSTRVYVNDTFLTKGKVGGFAVSGRTPTKTAGQKFIDLTKLNYFIGHESGKSNTTGIYNSFVGYNAGYSNIEGNYNIFIGYKSGFSNTVGQYNTFIGYQSGYNNIGNNLPAVWQKGRYNSYYGFQAGFSSTNADNCVLVGYQAGYSNTASANTFIGSEAGRDNQDAPFNTFLGCESGQINTTGGRNTFIGKGSGSKNMNGFQNVYIGVESGNRNQSGESNVMIGYLANYGNSGINNGGSKNNVIIGAEAAVDLNGSNNVLIGYKVAYEATSLFNKLIIENSEEFTNPLIYGDFANDKIAFHKLGTSFPFQVGTDATNGNGAYLTSGGTWTSTSSKTLKDRFVEIDKSELFARIIGLELNGWYYKDTEEFHIGPFSEDFYSAFGTGDKKNVDVNKALSASDVAGVSLMAVQELILENMELKKQLLEITKRLENLEK